MTRRIVCIQGSPRPRGNTRAMAALALEAARRQGAEVTEIDALKLTFRHPGCTGCRKCQASEVFRCTVDDELGRAVATLPDHDVILVATPIYWWSYTAQIKMVIDRMFCLSKFAPDGRVRSALAGRTLALLATGGGALEDNLDLLERQWSIPAAYLGCPFVSCLFPDTPPEAGALARDPAAAARARDFGRRLAGA
jgi:multimeric flavodoxin WrbA